MKQLRLAILVLMTLTLASCSSDPEWADPEAHEKTEQLREKYTPLITGTWHYEHKSDNHRFFEQLTFKEDGTLTGYRKWQSRSLVTIEGEQRYTDWQDVEEECGTFTGTWSLRYWSPEGNAKEKRNCLLLTATFDKEIQHLYLTTAYSNVCDFDHADADNLCFRSSFFVDANGWTYYQRGEAEPGF